MIIGIIALVVIVILVALFLMRSGSLGRSDSTLEDDFFKTKDDITTSAVLHEELTSHQAPIRSTATIKPPETTTTSEWAEPTTEVAVASEPARTAASKGGACPDCGNAMEHMGPESGGLYCPMCGHKEEG